MKNTIIKVIIIVAAVLAVGAIAFAVSTKVLSSEEPTTQSSELVAPAVGVPTGSNAENEADATQSWNETETLVHGIDIETTAPELPDEQPGEVETLADAQTIDVTDLSESDRVLLVLNAENKLPSEYVPHLEETVLESGIYLEAAAAEAFMEMYKAALGQGLTLTPNSGYVSFDRQQKRYEDLVDKYADMGYSEKEAQSLAARKILPAGCSEHNAGLAVDFGSNNASFADTAEYKWLVRNAAKYGFIERYTAEGEDETGVEAAPWHWRYVGSAAIAEAINESGLTFEEWMDSEYPYWESPEEESEEATVEEDASDAEDATDENASEVVTEAEEESATQEESTSEAVVEADRQ